MREPGTHACPDLDRPVVVLGVPRSGTTLLRVLLGAHSALLALPETPWLLGSYGREPSLRTFMEHLEEHRRGAVRNMRHLGGGDVRRAARAFLAVLLDRPLQLAGARHVVFKTPDDVVYLDHLVRLLPDARYVHIVRDGRDVTLSTMRRFATLNHYGKATAAACLRRWVDFVDRVRARDDVALIHVRYEDLVTDPAMVLRRICAFLGLSFEKAMLVPDLANQDLPDREVGAQDVLRRAGTIGVETGRWRTVALTAEQRQAFNDRAADLERLGYEPHRFALSRSERLLMRPEVQAARERIATLKERLRA
jgi:hypothetical protein